MDTLSYKTLSASNAMIEKKWLLIDASNAVVGRMASQVARLLQGKHKVEFTPNVDCGDHVVIINADKVRFTGKKWTNKVYVRHTGYPGGQRFATPREVVARRGYATLLEKTIKGMLPKTKLGREVFHNLHIYEGTDHVHAAQNPQPYTLNI
ncbi:MAG: 50S ribosomal protein L13 [Bacteroidetes bacterium]|nr:MAG: 50S ribosomal protein L13 [Bacteroidota bacterium]